MSSLAQKGIAETAKRSAIICSQVCEYACDSGLVEYNAASGPGRIAGSIPVRHRAAIVDPLEIGRLLLDMDFYQGLPSTCHCLMIMPYVFVRNSELCNARWSEIDLDSVQ